jgi:hypothetical protein
MSYSALGVELRTKVEGAGVYIVGGVGEEDRKIFRLG